MRTSHLILALIALCLFYPAAAYAEATPVSDLLASQCRQLEGAHGPTKEFPNTFYANLVFQCTTRPGSAPAGVVFKEIEQYGKALAASDARSGSRCEITQANGGANILSQGPMEPTEPSASKDVVISYNAKYACLSPRAARGLPGTSLSSGVNFAAVPYADNSGTSEQTLEEQVSYIPPREAWVARDAYYNTHHARAASAQKALYTPVHRYHRHHNHAATKAQAEKKPVTQKVKVEVKVSRSPVPAPVIIQGGPSPSHGPAPTSPLPGFQSP